MRSLAICLFVLFVFEPAAEGDSFESNPDGPFKRTSGFAIDADRVP